MRSRILGLFCALLLAATSALAQVELKVELKSGLSTSSSRKGDRVTGKVLEPQAFQGDTVEGKVTRVKRGDDGAALTFSFETLKHGGQTVPIASEIQSIANSKGESDVDEDGNAIDRNNNQENAADIEQVGSALGGLLGGKAGNVVDTTASKAAQAIVLIDCVSDGSSLSLAPGSIINLSATSRGGADLAGLAPNKASGSASAARETASSAASAAAQPAAQSAQTAQADGQPDLVAIKSDFVPGDKVLLYDDFSDMVGNEPPPHWKVRGGTAELRTGGGVRQITMTAQQMTLTPNVRNLPANFTMEADVVLKGNPARTWWRLVDKSGENVMHLVTWANDDEMSLQIYTPSEDMASQMVPMDFSKPLKQALWVQNGRIRFYINGRRLMDVNQIELPALDRIEVDVDAPGDADPSGYVGIQFFRFAEASPDFSQVIAASGRYVTRGILFDTDSDVIRPESGPVIRMIAKGLETNPALKIRIEGHTDSSGAAAHNMDLSKRRAEAVKAVLVSQFKIDPARLTTDGLGATKPVDTNDTPQGRAQNRRVELVKQ